jgi:site-specific recombinase XerD
MSEDDLLARFEAHLVQLAMAPATITNYIADLQNFAAWFDEPLLGGVALVDAQSEHIHRYCHFLHQQGRSSSTINRRLQAVRKFYDFTLSAGLSSHNPARDVDRFSSGEETLAHTLSVVQVTRLLGTVNNGSDSLSRRDRAIIHVLLDTGIKVRELVDLRVEDLDLDVGSGYLWIGHDLESGGRCLVLGPETCAALRAYMDFRVAAPGVDHVFVSRQGRVLSARTVQRLVSKRARSAGLVGVSAQTLRYTFAHDALEQWDIQKVARMLGLRDVASAQRYLGQKPGT